MDQSKAFNQLYRPIRSIGSQGPWTNFMDQSEALQILIDQSEAIGVAFRTNE